MTHRPPLLITALVAGMAAIALQPAMAAGDNAAPSAFDDVPALGEPVAGPAAAPASRPPTAAAAQPAATPAGAASAPWDASCTGTDRSHPLDCQVEQRVVISNTGQLLIDMTLRLPDGATDPVMLIHTPFGIFLPAGLRLSVDGADLADLPLQTCDGGGCYAGSTVKAQLLNAMQHGSTLTVTLQDLQKKDIAIPVSLLGFNKAYGQIR